MYIWEMENLFLVASYIRSLTKIILKANFFFMSAISAKKLKRYFQVILNNLWYLSKDFFFPNRNWVTLFCHFPTTLTFCVTFSSFFNPPKKKSFRRFQHYKEYPTTFQEQHLITRLFVAVVIGKPLFNF